MTANFYFPSNGIAPIRPSYDPYWDDTKSSVQRISLVAAHPTGLTPLVEAVTQGRTGSNPDGRNLLVRQYISDPLDAQYITGIFKGQFQTRGTGFDTQFFSQIIVKVVSNDGKVLRGILFDGDEESNPNMISLADTWVDSETNRLFPRGSVYPMSLTPLQTIEGDRLVIELGYRSLHSSFASHSAAIRFGDNGVGDLPVDQVNTSDNLNPWCSFSFAVSLYGPGIDFVAIGTTLVIG